MKLFKELGKEIRFLLLLLVGSCLLIAMFHSTPQNFSLGSLNWTEQQPSQKDKSEKGSTNYDIQDDASENDEELVPSKPICDHSDWRSDICNMTGDVRTKGYNSSSIFFIPRVHTLVPKEQEWRINPYSQKMYTYFINYVTVKQLRGPQDAPICTVHSNSPAILLSLGGPSGNIWHDFTDVLIPLFLASKPFKREVQFMISSYNQEFVDKHSLILKDLTRYEIINFDQDKEVRCYPQMLVGLLNHRDFGIDPDRAFDRFDMFKFRLYVRNVYSLPREISIPYRTDPHLDKKPRLMLILRSTSRKFLNQEEVVDIITKNGFEVLQVEPKKSDNLTELSKLVDSCDVLMGIHGAGLTNIVFLRTNAVMIQVIPFGGSHMNNAAHGYYDRPAQEMKLRTLDYTITTEESSLLDKYGWDHPAVKDPEAVAETGWQDRQKYYWLEQDVRLNVTRFQPVLVKAIELLKG
ncbi:EGF domain-specific O-linked N-acetylglucosamine transferase [Rhynchospora pubera]|uniref:EGF domain-specific O-linked N-acetylglucosamine transferase n=1 Tax=Rhynchospora pubera TaxID=906938 RepID=A0AAV8GUS9_9POAL|nr:EGF domain-specific O-linked N-acetylglucosamine transferase [Rhynchospora pubera]